MLHIIHVGAFLGCLFGSFNKNRLAWRGTLDGRGIVSIRRFDKLTGTSSGVLILTGLALLFWWAGNPEYYFAAPLFWIKIGLFTLVSGLIIWTKTDFRKALAEMEGGTWQIPTRIRAILAFDFVCVIAMGLMGRALATGGFDRL